MEIKGDSLFPQYGIDQAFLSQKLNETYSKLDPWMSISDMHFLADSLTIAYQSKGLTFNQVFVVPNEIQNNTLILNVLSGKISEINVKNNQLYSEEQVKTWFNHLLGKVIYEPDIQEAMQQANAVPGFKVFGFFSMGSNPGQSRLNLHVLKEQKRSFSARADNYGVNNTGVYRIIGEYQENNLTGVGDTLQVNLVSTNEFGNLYGGVSYTAPRKHESKIGASLYTNFFEVVGDFEEFGLNGHLTGISVFMNGQLLKAKNAIAHHAHVGSIKHSEIRSDSESNEINDILSENTDYLLYQPSFSASVVTLSGKHKQSLGVSAKLGAVSKTDNEDIDDTISVLDIFYEHSFRWKEGHPTEYVTSVNGSVHYAFGVLPSSERKVMTGPYAVRGYKPALFSADTVYSVTVQQTFEPLPLQGKLKLAPFAFFDSATGEQNDETGEKESFNGAGLGLDFGYEKDLTGNLTIAWPLNPDTDLYEDSDEITVYGNIKLMF